MVEWVQQKHKKLIHDFTSNAQIMHSKDAYKHWYVLDLGSN